MHNFYCFLLSTVPAVAPSPRGIVRESATSIRVTFAPLLPEESRGIVTSYHVKYRPLDSSRTARRNLDDVSTVINTTESEVVITDLDPRLQYAIALAASTAAGMGNYSEVMIAECK